jgi:hypothetical protein
MTVSAQRVEISVFDDPSILDLTRRQSGVVLPLLLDFLTKYRPRVGQILLGLRKEVGRTKI